MKSPGNPPVKAFEKIIFGPGTPWRTWGTRPEGGAGFHSKFRSRIVHNDGFHARTTSDAEKGNRPNEWPTVLFAAGPRPSGDLRALRRSASALRPASSHTRGQSLSLLL